MFLILKTIFEKSFKKKENNVLMLFENCIYFFNLELFSCFCIF